MSDTFAESTTPLASPSQTERESERQARSLRAGWLVVSYIVYQKKACRHTTASSLSLYITIADGRDSGAISRRFAKHTASRELATRLGRTRSPIFSHLLRQPTARTSPSLPSQLSSAFAVFACERRQTRDFTPSPLRLIFLLLLPLLSTKKERDSSSYAIPLPKLVLFLFSFLYLCIFDGATLYVYDVVYCI